MMKQVPTTLVKTFFMLFRPGAWRTGWVEVRGGCRRARSLKALKRPALPRGRNGGEARAFDRAASPLDLVAERHGRAAGVHKAALFGMRRSITKNFD